MDQGNQVTTIAGNGEGGFQDGNALEAMFCNPRGLCCSVDGKLYVADNMNDRIRMIYNGQVTTIAGNGLRGFQDGNALEARFCNPTGICCSIDGKLYVADSNNNRIRMIYNGQVTTISGKGKEGFKDGNALKSKFSYPTGICCTTDGRLYITDNYNHRIRMIHNGKVTTIAGNGKGGFQDGKALKSMFCNPIGICCSTDGILYVSDKHSDRIRMIYNGEVTTIAGNSQHGFKDGNALEAMFYRPQGICCSSDGRLYVSDSNNNRIRMICNGQVTTIAGNDKEGFQDGNALEAIFHGPNAICFSNDGKFYVSDETNHRIRVICNY